MDLGAHLWTPIGPDYIQPFSGTVSGDYLVGGLIGFCTFAFGPNRDNTLNNCYARSNASATIGRVGGLYGGNQGALIISNCYATGTATGTELTGGFIGVSGGMNATNSYWDTETSAHATGIGGWEGPQTPQEITGKTTVEMKTLDMVDSLNFGQTNGPWTIDPSINDGYPAFESLTTGIAPAERTGYELNVFPALFNNTVRVASDAGLIACSVYSITGQMVHGTGLNGRSAVLDLGMLSPGAYLLQVITGEGTTVRRIVKQ
ncbi:MAG: T9SS type A sorting domain-containing protein [Flavobacteriales bacterium]|nr:T9SS type A sorting domain-containing protein [Flavobacteriales bacterium]